jgi:hypothetical protein
VRPLPALLSTRIIARAHQMQRDIWLLAYDPTVMTSLYVEDVTCFHLNHVAVVHCGGGRAGNDYSDVFDFTTGLESARPSPDAICACDPTVLPGCKGEPRQPLL